MGNLLEIRQLSIDFYDHGAPERVVDKVSIQVGEGEIVGIVGESGSGKSMTALAVTRLLSEYAKISEGEILFDGVNVAAMTEAELRSLRGGSVSMIFQEPMVSLNPVMKIGPQVEEELLIHTKLNPKERKEQALAALRDAELPDPERVYNSYPHELSGGMRQRAMIAAAIANHPKFLIADEPTTALDVTIQKQILELLKKLSVKYNIAVLFISHDLAVVRQLCSRVVVMQQGRVVEQGEIQEIFHHPREEYTKKLLASIPNHETKTVVMEKPGEPILTLNHVSSYYREKQGILGKVENHSVLKDISFSLYEGESLGLVGESGCGKTTLSKVILGLVKTYEGEVIHHSALPQMIFQDPFSALNPMKKIGWILQEPLRIQGKLNPKERYEKAVNMLKNVGLDEEYMKRYPGELSGGQRQRVSIALALMLDSKLIIADEPVSALDVTVQAQIMELLNRLRAEKKLSYLFISHDLDVIYQMCDRAMVMKDGQIVETGTVEELFSNPQHEYTKKLLEALH